MEPNLPSSFDSSLDLISDILSADMERRNQECEKRGLGAVSGTLKTNLEAAAKGNADAAFQVLAYYERELQEYHQAEDDDTCHRIFWVFYEPAAKALSGITIHKEWPLLASLIGAYLYESDDEPFAGPVVENAVGRHIVWTQRRDDVGVAPAETLTYLGSLWDSNKDTSWEESFTCGWGIGYPEYPIGG